MNRKDVTGGDAARETTDFPIASAGGLEAFKKFFSAMPPDSGMASPSPHAC
ncbi:MAG: hypothetical protein ACHQ4J_01645 [Candidatus Binatia bacterium]